MIRELSSETGCLRCPVEDRALGCLASVFFASSVSSLWCEVMCQRGFQVLDESHRCLKTPLGCFVGAVLILLGCTLLSVVVDSF